MTSDRVGVGLLTFLLTCQAALGKLEVTEPQFPSPCNGDNYCMYLKIVLRGGCKTWCKKQKQKKHVVQQLPRLSHKEALDVASFKISHGVCSNAVGTGCPENLWSSHS